jgi:hypothetical protein
MEYFERQLDNPVGIVIFMFLISRTRAIHATGLLSRYRDFVLKTSGKYQETPP